MIAHDRMDHNPLTLSSDKERSMSSGGERKKRSFSLIFDLVFFSSAVADEL